MAFVSPRCTDRILSSEAQNRAAFIDFVQGLLNLNPIERWSPQQARLHPFITGEKFIRPYVVSQPFLLGIFFSDYSIFASSLLTVPQDLPLSPS
jgi:serine/threonine protein kinase